MRNSGWYIPFWRKPKRTQGEATPGEKQERRRRPRTRSDDDLERVREEWVTRYTNQVRALKMLGLSVGAPRAEIQARYQRLVSEVGNTPEGHERLRLLQSAFEALREE
jgi:hypothetical protein